MQLSKTIYYKIDKLEVPNKFARNIFLLPNGLIAKDATVKSFIATKTKIFLMESLDYDLMIKNVPLNNHWA